MTIDVKALAAQLAGSIVASLKSESAEVQSFALAEAEELAQALARIGGLLLQHDITREEAAVLVRVQAGASETVLASLAEISSRAARRAIKLGLHDVIGLVDDALGAPLIRSLL